MANTSNDDAALAGTDMSFQIPLSLGWTTNETHSHSRRSTRTADASSNVAAAHGTSHPSPILPRSKLSSLSAIATRQLPTTR
jgi:hypothetical protein